jgi:hypothetical protein
MRLAKVLLVLVIASAAVFVTTLLVIDGYPQLATAQAQSGVTRQHARSALFRFHMRSPRRARALVNPNELADYARECERATGIKIPDFSCLDGDDVPGQETTSNGRCVAPNVLNGQCDPGSHFQVLKGGTLDAVAVAHCRKVGLSPDQERPNDVWNDIAIIQYNKRNGAICFYQALTDQPPDGVGALPLPGTDIPSPIRRGDDARWSDGVFHWLSPTQTEAIGCTGCHDNGGFIRSPYIIQTKKHVLPSEKEGFDNKNTRLRYVGKAFRDNRSWSIETKNAAGDTGGNCAQCHRMAVSNHILVQQAAADPAVRQLGTALSFGPISTARTQANKVKHSEDSPIWMRPDDVIHNPAAEATAQRFRNCAVELASNDFDVAIKVPGCTFKELGLPYFRVLPYPGSDR